MKVPDVSQPYRSVDYDKDSIKLLTEAAPWLPPKCKIFYNVHTLSSPKITFFGANFNCQILCLK